MKISSVSPHAFISRGPNYEEYRFGPTYPYLSVLSKKYLAIAVPTPQLVHWFERKGYETRSTFGCQTPEILAP